MLSKYILKILLVWLFFVSALFANNKVACASEINETSKTGDDLIIFWGQGCPHCEKAQEFLNELEITYPEAKFKRLEVYYNQENQQKMQQMAVKLNARAGAVPFIVIRDKYFVGFSEDTKVQLEQKIKEYLGIIENTEPTLLVADKVTIMPTAPPKVTLTNEGNTTQNNLNLPIVGSVNLLNLSLPLITILIGFIDGFNPCAMWVLLFLISLLIPIENKKRRWGIGVGFIVSSAFVYFLFLAAWLNIFMFLTFVPWIKIVVGTIALMAGSYFLRDFFVNKSGGCKGINEKERTFFFTKIKKVVNEKKLLYIIIGIFFLAFSVNIVELVCSAGLPAIYTNILSSSNLPIWQYYLYLLLYILFFMIDDLLIFFIAMITLETVGIQQKYARYSHLLGGIIMSILGLLLIFKPELLMFG